MRPPAVWLSGRSGFQEAANAFTVSPATGKQIRVFPEIGDAELLDALKAADTCYLTRRLARGCSGST
jgi:hypothetical protein